MTDKKITRSKDDDHTEACAQKRPPEQVSQMTGRSSLQSECIQ
ncbi:hypothetical protein [Oceanicoccus sp. KOV_DT_Chl]|nr:hypothetical protein [Oceanicoccus sp. KOV_DT_Chl]